MYITITPQQTKGNFSQSVSDYAAYLEKENEGLSLEHQEPFFNQYETGIPLEAVVQEIDGNTTKLSKKEPKFYAITISPSQSELKALKNPSKDLKIYTRAVMKEYVESFNREIDGRKVTVDDLKYYAKIEHKRYYKGTDKEVRLNQPYASQILDLKQQLRAIDNSESIKETIGLKKQIQNLERLAPKKIDGKRIVNGMEKPGLHTHIHIIMSRKDASNAVSLSPGSKYKASEVEFNGKVIKRGFDRDKFFIQSEKVFDVQFGFKRSFPERYESRKLLQKDFQMYYRSILGLPQGERALAMKALGKMGVVIPNIPLTSPRLALKAIKTFKKAMSKAVQSSSIGI